MKKDEFGRNIADSIVFHNVAYEYKDGAARLRCWDENGKENQIVGKYRDLLELCREFIEFIEHAIEVEIEYQKTDRNGV